MTSDNVTTETDAVSDNSPAWLREEAARIITEAINNTGSVTLRHPDQPDVLLVIPGFQNVARTPKAAEAMDALAHHLGEAIIHTVLAELDCQLITTTDLQALHHNAVNAVPHTIEVTDRRTGQHLFTLAVPAGTNTAQVNWDRLRNRRT